jgi:ABC-type dipeptide/oligopeptide/nickel transport system permease component
MQYVIRRLIFLVPTLFGILVLVFLLRHLTPGDPVQLLVDVDVATMPQEQIERLRREFGLDRPLPEQFMVYLANVLRGDLGTSYRSKLPVMNYVQQNFMPTLQLAIAGLILAVLIGVPAGIISALRPNSALDHFTLTLSMIGLSAPSFWLGILLLYVFAFRLTWFPMIGNGDGSPWDTARALVLPALVIGVHAAALLARLTRSAMLEVLGQDYVRTAHSKGLRSRTVIIRHALHNSAVPVVAAAGTTFAYLLTGSVVVELVFSRQGLGWLMVNSINGRDFPLVQGLILIFGLIIVLANLFSDLLIGAIDPRIKHG